MFWFTVQFAILLLAAYFAGAMLGCMMRRTFFPHTLRSDAPQRVTVAAPAATSTGTSSVTAQAPAAPQTRFERALTGTAERAVPSVQPAPVAPIPAAPAPVAPAPIPSAPIPRAPVVAQAPVNPAPAAAPVPVAPVSPAPVPAATAPAPSAPTAPAVDAAVTAAVTAVAAAARAQQLPAGILPAAMGTSGLATVSAPSAPVASAAPVAPPAPVVSAPAAQPQDLTRIRAIDDAMQKALDGLGVKSFADIAGWKPDDVARVASALKIPGRIEQENWIEQAQILAKGGETYYSRRKLKGELPSSRPTPDEGERITVRVPAAMRPTDSSPAPTIVAAPVAVPTAAAPVVSSAAAQAASAVQAAQAVVTAAPAAATAAAAAVAAVAAKVAAPVAPVPAPPVSGPVSAPVAPVVVAPVPSAPAAAATAAAAAMAAAAAKMAAPAAVVPPPPAAAGSPVVTPPASSDRPIGMARDDLQRIAGINTEVERLLNVQGVTRYGQIADWSPSDMSRFDRLLGFEGRIARENWIEQAQILSKGGETAYARDYARRTSEAARPARLAEAIQGRAVDAAAKAAPAAAAVVPERAAREDLSTLRSVRSEAYRGTDAAAGAGIGAGPGRPSDDLKRIRGVGVLIEKKLNALGVTRYDQVANWTQSDIERFSEKLDFNGRIERENWVEQARILSAGGQTEFSQRVDRGEVETSRLKT